MVLLLSLRIKNNLMSETFRNLRTNLQFMLDNDQKVILSDFDS